MGAELLRSLALEAGGGTERGPRGLAGAGGRGLTPEGAGGLSASTFTKESLLPVLRMEDWRERAGVSRETEDCADSFHFCKWVRKIIRKLDRMMLRREIL